MTRSSLAVLSMLLTAGCGASVEVEGGEPAGPPEADRGPVNVPAVPTARPAPVPSHVPVPLPPICERILLDGGAPVQCIDGSCEDSQWCAVSCCDPVTHHCHNVGICVPKFAPGVDCDYVIGDTQCASGVCGDDGLCE